MAVTCVGCGLEVVGGRLKVQEGGVCGQPDLGIICDADDGHLDIAHPVVTLNTVDNVHGESDTLPVTLLSGVQVRPEHFSVSYDGADGVLSFDPDVGLGVLCEGLYSVHLTIGPTTDGTGRLIGGRARVYVNGTDILSSSGFIEYGEPTNSLASASGNDGPEWSCSSIEPLFVGNVLTWEGLAITSANGIDVQYPETVNRITVARLGRLR